MDYVGIFTIGGIAMGLSLMTQLVNKLTINENKVERITKEMNDINKELKTLSPKSKEFETKQEKMLDINLDRMKMQFKPMMFTFIPYIIIFSIISGTFAYNPLEMGSTIEMSISGTGHVYSECFDLDQNITKKFQETLVIGSENCTMILGSTETQIELGQKQIVSFGAEDLKIQITPEEKTYIELPVSIPIAGDSIEWIGVFILFSFASSMVLSKLLKGKQLRKWED